MPRMSPAGDYYNRMVLGLIKDYEGNLHSFQVNRILIKKNISLKERVSQEL
jgi:hypothetical protein